MIASPRGEPTRLPRWRWLSLDRVARGLTSGQLSDDTRPVRPMGPVRHVFTGGAAAWIATIAAADGGIPFVLETAADYPHAP